MRWGCIRSVAARRAKGCRAAWGHGSHCLGVAALPAESQAAMIMVGLPGERGNHRPRECENVNISKLSPFWLPRVETVSVERPLRSRTLKYEGPRLRAFHVAGFEVRASPIRLPMRRQTFRPFACNGLVIRLG
jgi:hypothetical protein